MQSNPIIWTVIALNALAAFISFLQEPAGVQWLSMLWAR